MGDEVVNVAAIVFFSNIFGDGCFKDYVCYFISVYFPRVIFSGNP